MGVVTLAACDLVNNCSDTHYIPLLANKADLVTLLIRMKISFFESPKISPFQFFSAFSVDPIIKSYLSSEEKTTKIKRKTLLFSTLTRFIKIIGTFSIKFKNLCT